MVPTTATKIQRAITGKCQSLQYTGKTQLVLDTKTEVEILFLDKYHCFLDYITCMTFLHVSTVCTASD